MDVVGPRDRERTVLMRLNRTDGRDEGAIRTFAPEDREELRSHLEGLSTFARFLRFARDFRHAEKFELAYELVSIDGESFVRTSLENACEFLSKKDYTDNWASEMHETFCFWDFREWVDAAMEAGFRVLDGSRDFANPWIIENRYRTKAELFDESMRPLDAPATNMILVLEKSA